MTSIALEEFESNFGSLIELSSVALGGSIVSVSDDFFAEASCMLRVEPSASLKGQFGPNGALFDGWESRRHCPTYDWAIIKLGTAGTIHGVDIDTGHFNGNESPASDVWGAFVEEGDEIKEDSTLWFSLLPLSPLGPASRHLFKFDKPSPPVSHMKLTMHPDGGLGRFRAYGFVLPPIASSSSCPIKDAEAKDLASVLSGARVVGESDQHFGRGGNLILPGRGLNMGDGWETKRSRGRLGSGKGDWVVIKLGEPGYLEWVDLDTLHFVGNFPESAELYGIVSDEELPSQDANWTLLLNRTKLGPHRQHFFQLSHCETPFTHVRLSIYPDGGVKRVRLYGRRASQFPNYSTLTPLPSPEFATQQILTNGHSNSHSTSTSKPSTSILVPKIPALPLTPDAFSAYGFVIQSYSDLRSARKDVIVKPVNFGTANKFNNLAPVKFIQPPHNKNKNEGKVLKGEVNFCVFRCDSQNGLKINESGKESWEVKVLERHEYSSQAFVPMGNGGGRYLVLVALPGVDSKPDLSTLRAFMATSSQGISYHPNIWHHPIIALDETTDFACMVNETGDAEIDCEIVKFDQPVALVLEV